MRTANPSRDMLHSRNFGEMIHATQAAANEKTMLSPTLAI